MNVFVLLDQSGSMAMNWQETIGAINGYVHDLAEGEATRMSKVSIYTFDSGIDGFRFVTLRNQRTASTDYKDVDPVETYPRGGTPLYDAISRLSEHVSDVGGPTTVVIVTDGEENSSRESTKATAKLQLDAMRSKGYDVIFLGADFENFGQAQGMGNAVGSTMTMAKGSYRDASMALASKTAFYASSGAPRGFTDQERAAARGG